VRLYTRIALLTLIPVVAGGCSFVLVEAPPPGHQELSSFECTEEKTVPTVDAIFTGLNASSVIGIADGDPTDNKGVEIAFALGVGVLQGVSAWTGAKRVDECRARNAPWLTGARRSRASGSQWTPVV
jgi:hypothetical protein